MSLIKLSLYSMPTYFYYSLPLSRYNTKFGIYFLKSDFPMKFFCMNFSCKFDIFLIGFFLEEKG